MFHVGQFDNRALMSPLPPPMTLRLPPTLHSAHMRLHSTPKLVSEPPAVASLFSMRHLLQTEAIATHFQPIFSVRQKSIVGMEALSRGRATDGRLIAPYDLFKSAAAEDLSADLERLCRRTAVGSFAGLPSRPDELLLFLNLDLAADAADPRALPAALAALVRDADLLPRNVAVEFLEARLED